MNAEIAEHISALAAPIYAALLQQILSVDGLHAPAELIAKLRKQAIVEAEALWAATLEAP